MGVDAPDVHCRSDSRDVAAGRTIFDTGGGEPDPLFTAVFTEGPDRELQFTPDDKDTIETAVAELMKLKEERPALLPQSWASLRSIPDWLIKGPDMASCDRYRLIWVGADGTVQMCYVTFKLGNLHENRLKDMLFTPEHHDAARNGFKLNCPNCHCGYPTRIQSHLPSLLRYS